MRKQQQNIQLMLAMANNDADLILDCPKLSQVNREDVNSLFSHKSKAICLAAKEQHKKALRQHRANWYELLNDSDQSDQDDTEFENVFDASDYEIANFNFRNFRHQTRLGLDSNSNQNHRSVSKKEREQLKTNNLRKQIANMMAKTPDKSKIWNKDIFAKE